MKPTMTFAIVMITAIIIIASFGLTMGPTTPIELSPDVAGRALFVCPAQSATWDSIALAMRPMNRYIIYAFFGATLILMSVWGWNLYQNLLEDKFKRSSFTKPWQFTKLLFWATVIVLLLAMTPNHFRRITLTGADGQWVLCESNTPGARAVRADAVHAH